MSNIYKPPQYHLSRQCTPYREATLRKPNCLYSWKNLINPEINKLYPLIVNERGKISSFYHQNEKKNTKDGQMSKSLSQKVIEKEDFSIVQKDQIKISRLTKPQESGISHTFGESLLQSKILKSQLSLSTLKMNPVNYSEGLDYREEQRAYLRNKFIEHLNRHHGTKI